ncbi:MmgE/PrpD family protein [Microbacterium sp. NPDC056044]|uniref:MmgE/PrpD family protein n=1 Tax=Microbacterium sp. NPDC056044 TaxID=3345690 RepID=UPI0035E1BB3E
MAVAVASAERLARFAAGVDWESLPVDARAAAKLLVLDTLVCIVAGTAVEPRTSRLTAAMLRTAGVGRSAVAGEAERMDAATAAALNSEFGGALSAQESLFFSHTANLHLATALAVAEQEGRSGVDVLEAFVAGFEVSGALHLARRPPLPPQTPVAEFQPSRNEYMTIGAAVAAAVALGEDEATVAHALSIAAALAPGDGGNVAPLADVNYCDYASKARAAVDAAHRAAAGLTGRLECVDEKLLAGVQHPIPSFEDLGRVWSVTQTSIKFFPGCRFISGPIGAFAAIVRDEGLRAGEIDAVEVRVSALALSNPKIPRVFDPDPADAADPLNLVFNAPYHAALVAHGVEPGPEWYDARTRARADVVSFLPRVRVVEDPAMSERLRDAAAAERHGRVAFSGGAGVVVRARGSVFTASCDYVRGDPVRGAPAAAYDEVVAKAHGFLDPILGVAQVARLCEAAARLDEIEDLAELTGLLGARRLPAASL